MAIINQMDNIRFSQLSVSAMKPLLKLLIERYTDQDENLLFKNG